MAFGLNAGDLVIFGRQKNHRHLNVTLAHHLDQIKPTHTAKVGVYEYEIVNRVVEQV